eukprot:382205-Hanusia_phi.AAC.1
MEEGVAEAGNDDGVLMPATMRQRRSRRGDGEGRRGEGNGRDTQTEESRRMSRKSRRRERRRKKGRSRGGGEGGGGGAGRGRMQGYTRSGTASWIVFTSFFSFHRSVDAAGPEVACCCLTLVSSRSCCTRVIILIIILILIIIVLTTTTVIATLLQKTSPPVLHIHRHCRRLEWRHGDRRHPQQTSIVRIPGQQVHISDEHAHSAIQDFSSSLLELPVVDLA